LKHWDKSIYGITSLEDLCNARLDFWLSGKDVNQFQYEVEAKSMSNVAKQGFAKTDIENRSREWPIIQMIGKQ